MEGYLYRYINLVVRWRSTYCILHNDILTMLDKKGGETWAKIHMKISSVVPSSDDALRFTINSGTNEFIMRASSAAERLAWTNILREASERSFEQQTLDLSRYEQATRNNPHLDLRTKAVLLDTQQQQIDDLLAKIWETQANFSSSLSTIATILNKNTGLVEEAIKLEKQGHYLKKYVTDCAHLIQEERKRIHRAAIYLKEEQIASNGDPGSNGFSPYSESYSQEQQRLPLQQQELEIEEARPEFIEHPFFSKTNNVSRSYNNNNNGTRGNGSYYATNGSGEEDCGTLYESFVGDDQQCLSDRSPESTKAQV